MEKGLFHNRSHFFKEHARALLKESQKCVIRSLMRSISVSVIKVGVSVWLSSLFLSFSAEPAEIRRDTSVATQIQINCVVKFSDFLLF